jgi:hypothetical protein
MVSAYGNTNGNSVTNIQNISNIPQNMSNIKTESVYDISLGMLNHLNNNNNSRNLMNNSSVTMVKNTNTYPSNPDYSNLYNNQIYSMPNSMYGNYMNFG